MLSHCTDWDYVYHSRKGRIKVAEMKQALIISRMYRHFTQISISNCQGYLKILKAVPLQACSGPEVYRKLRFPDFVTMAQDGGKVVSLTHRPLLPPGNTPGTHFC